MGATCFRKKERGGERESGRREGEREGKKRKKEGEKGRVGGSPRDCAMLVREEKYRARPRSPSFTRPSAVTNTLAGLISGEMDGKRKGFRG